MKPEKARLLWRIKFGLKPEEEEWRFGLRYAFGSRPPGLTPDLGPMAQQIVPVAENKRETHALKPRG